MEAERSTVVALGVGWAKYEVIGKSVQTSIYNRDKFQGSNVQHGDHSNTLLYT